MNSLRRVSHQVIRPEQSLKIAVHQPAVPVGPAVAVTTRGMSMVDQLNAKVRNRKNDNTSRYEPYLTQSHSFPFIGKN
jgi:hypothetical protein